MHRPALLLRIAAVLVAVQGFSHGAMSLTYRPSHGAAEVAVVDAMQSNYFLFGGHPRSYWDFYTGYAMMGAFTCLVEAFLFWQLSRFAATHAAPVRAAAGAFVLFNVGHALLATRFFFLTPVGFDLVVAALVGAAFVMLGNAGRERVSASAITASAQSSP